MFKMERPSGSVDLRPRKHVLRSLYKEASQDHPEEQDKDEGKERDCSLKSPESPYSFQNVVWFITSIAVFYWTDFATTALYDTRVKRSWFHIGVFLIFINVSIGAFLIVFLSYVKKIHSEEWEQMYPAAIPIATASFAFGSCCLIVGLWPVWGLLTPVILFVEFMGVVVVIAALPGR